MKKNRRNSSTCDDLSISKAAAWAWYQRGSGSLDNPMLEFEAKKTRLQAPKPSRYKIEATRIMQQPCPLVSPHGDHERHHSLLDAYEVESITKQLDNLVLSSSKRFDEKEADPRKSGKPVKNGNSKKKRGWRRGIWWRGSVVCGAREDVDSRALVRTRPLPTTDGGRGG